MKLSWSLITCSLCCTVSAVRPQISAETARLIVAQRLGLSRFHSIERADPETIQHINTFGGRQQKLFSGGNAGKSKAHLLMWIENAEQDEATVIVNDGSEQTLEFSIIDPPPMPDNDRLIQDLILQAKSLPPYPDPQKQTYASSFEIEATIPSRYKVELYNEYLNVVRTGKSDGFSSRELSEVLSNINKKAEELAFSATIVLIPASKGYAKRTTHSWGAYDVPTKESRQKNLEDLSTSESGPYSSSNLELHSHDRLAAGLAENKNPVRGILPSCFDTMTSCQKMTHNCSSHGDCALLHKGRGSGSDRESTDCWGCACKPTVQHVGEDKGMESKTKTTYWGGSACQKKDISAQFWLFVGTGVILAFLVSSGIGMLYSMGKEDLPSVIGAGVSGPVRK